MSDSEKIKDLEQRLAACNSELERMMREQQEAGRLLVRRDLALSRANEQLKTLDVIKSDFISIAAHQLRTPLSAIKWIIHMLARDEFKSVVERKDFIQKASESTDRMISLVNDLLEADHIESGKYQFIFTPVDVAELIKGVATEVQTMAMQRNVKLSLELVSATINGDALKIRALFQNLIENAIKYTPQEGSVSIASAIHNDFLIISVSDTGIGIPEQQQDQIFSKFFRAANAVRVDTVGSGLGLFIAKEIVARHGGKIEFTSTINQGTTFTVSLPLLSKK